MTFSTVSGHGIAEQTFFVAPETSKAVSIFLKVAAVASAAGIISEILDGPTLLVLPVSSALAFLYFRMRSEENPQILRDDRLYQLLVDLKKAEQESLEREKKEPKKLD